MRLRESSSLLARRTLRPPDLSLLVEHAIASGTPRETPVSQILGVTPMPRAIHLIQIPERQLDIRTPRVRLTYAAMLSLCDVDGVVRASRRQLADATGQSLATIRRAIRALVAVGIVSRDGRELRCLLRSV